MAKSSQRDFPIFQCMQQLKIGREAMVDAMSCWEKNLLMISHVHCLVFLNREG